MVQFLCVWRKFQCKLGKFLSDKFDFFSHPRLKLFCSLKWIFSTALRWDFPKVSLATKWFISVPLPGLLLVQNCKDAPISCGECLKLSSYRTPQNQKQQQQQHVSPISQRWIYLQHQTNTHRGSARNKFPGGGTVVRVPHVWQASNHYRWHRDCGGTRFPAFDHVPSRSGTRLVEKLLGYWFDYYLAFLI